MNTIYLLRDPVTLEPRYVGVTSRLLEKRMRQHYYQAERAVNRPVCDWIRALVRRGLRPVVEVIEVTPDRMREAFWIAHYRAQSDRMLNMTDGGRDCPASNPAVAAKISAALKGRKLSPEHLAKCRARSPRNHTEETKAKMRKPKSEAHTKNAQRALAMARALGKVRSARGDANGMRKYPEKVLRGSHSPHAKLNEAVVQKMRLRFSAGETASSLARELNVSVKAARNAIQGRTWAHLPGACPSRGKGNRGFAAELTA